MISLIDLPYLQIAPLGRQHSPHIFQLPRQGPDRVNPGSSKPSKNGEKSSEKCGNIWTPRKMQVFMGKSWEHHGESLRHGWYRVIVDVYRPKPIPCGMFIVCDGFPHAIFSFRWSVFEQEENHMIKKMQQFSNVNMMLVAQNLVVGIP